MVCTVAYNNSDWAALYQNLNNYGQQWVMVVKLLAKALVAVRARAMLYKVVVQTVLLYEIKIWEVIGEMLTFLDIFYHWVARQFTGKIDWHSGDSVW